MSVVSWAEVDGPTLDLRNSISPNIKTDPYTRKTTISLWKSLCEFLSRPEQKDAIKNVFLANTVKFLWTFLPAPVKGAGDYMGDIVQLVLDIEGRYRAENKSNSVSKHELSAQLQRPDPPSYAPTLEMIPEDLRRDKDFHKFLAEKQAIERNKLRMELKETVKFGSGLENILGFTSFPGLVFDGDVAKGVIPIEWRESPLETQLYVSSLVAKLKEQGKEAVAAICCTPTTWDESGNVSLGHIDAVAVDDRIYCHKCYLKLEEQKKTLKEQGKPTADLVYNANIVDVLERKLPSWTEDERLQLIRTAVTASSYEESAGKHHTYQRQIELLLEGKHPLFSEPVASAFEARVKLASLAILEVPNPTHQRNVLAYSLGLPTESAEMDAYYRMQSQAQRTRFANDAVNNYRALAVVNKPLKKFI